MWLRQMLLFPETVIKAAVDTLKEVAIDDFKAEQYDRAVKHLTVRLRCTARALHVYCMHSTASTSRFALRRAAAPPHAARPHAPRPSAHASVHALHMQVALSLDEKSHVLYSNRCTAYIALDQYDKAMEDADECVRLQPSWAKGYLRRGSVFFRMNQLERAEQVLKEGLELDPTNDALKKVRCALHLMPRAPRHLAPRHSCSQPVGGAHAHRQPIGRAPHVRRRSVVWAVGREA